MKIGNRRVAHGKGLVGTIVTLVVLAVIVAIFAAVFNSASGNSKKAVENRKDATIQALQQQLQNQQPEAPVEPILQQPLTPQAEVALTAMGVRPRTTSPAVRAVPRPDPTDVTVEAKPALAKPDGTYEWNPDAKNQAVTVHGKFYKGKILNSVPILVRVNGKGKPIPMAVHANIDLAFPNTLEFQTQSSEPSDVQFVEDR